MSRGPALYAGVATDAGVETGELEQCGLDQEQSAVAHLATLPKARSGLRVLSVALLAATALLMAKRHVFMGAVKCESSCPEFADCSGFPGGAEAAHACHANGRHVHPNSPRDFVMLQQDIPSGPPGVLVRAYETVFKTGNRNSASHLWTSWLMKRSSTMTAAEFEKLFESFCGISGSIITKSAPDEDMIMPDGLGLGGVTRWRLALKDLSGAEHAGFMHYCTGCMAWPCLCDARENLKIDTKTISLKDGGQKKYNFVVIGNPCQTQDLAKQLNQSSFRDSAYGTQKPIALQMAAPELTCDGSLLQGATLSDNGHIMLAMFFDDDTNLAAHSEQAVEQVCNNRGESAGMGPIFRTLAGVNPL